MAVKNNEKSAKKVQRKSEELNKDVVKLGEDSSDESGDDFEGFSSTDGESDSEEGSDSEKSESESEGEEESKPKYDNKESSKHTIKKPARNSTTPSALAKNKRGIMYIGRLPKQVDEKDLMKYFKQFGDILNVRVSRNKKTGHSKHYGFIEFENYEVAKIAQDTMNNYLLFNHLLKCELVENTSENKEKFMNIFAKSSGSYRKVPWAKISKHRNDKPKSEEKLKKLKSRQDQNMKKRLEKLAEAGLEVGL